jgi:hypothetical protein
VQGNTALADYIDEGRKCTGCGSEDHNEENCPKTAGKTPCNSTLLRAAGGATMHADKECFCCVKKGILSVTAEQKPGMWPMVLFVRGPASTRVPECKPDSLTSPDRRRGSSAAEIAQVSTTHRRGVHPPTIHSPAWVPVEQRRQVHESTRQIQKAWTRRIILILKVHMFIRTWM